MMTIIDYWKKQWLLLRNEMTNEKANDQWPMKMKPMIMTNDQWTMTNDQTKMKKSINEMNDEMTINDKWQWPSNDIIIIINEERIVKPYYY